MVSTLNLEDKYNKVRRNFCFYLDIQEHGLARSLSRRLQDMGLQQEVLLSSRVTHVVRSSPAGAGAGVGAGVGAGAHGGRARCPRGARRADAMLERARPEPAHNPHVVHLSVQKAIALLDKLYDAFFTAPRIAQIKFFKKHFLKIEFLDKVCRPVYKEFDEWPSISLEPDPPKERKKESTITIVQTNDINQNQQIVQKMTRKSRPRMKEKEEKEPKGGYCEMCNCEYGDAVLHRRSPHHLAFVRDHTNFLALDSLITSGADVAAFLDKAAPLNGERRSLRKMCNGDVEPKSRRSKRSQSPDSTVNGNQSPKRNGVLDDERKHNTRCSKKTETEDRQYYKVVGVSTKLRSSGGFASKRKDSPPACNGKPLVVKFRKVRRSELSVLSDEAEQFMFPKRASSTSSTSSEDEVLCPRRKTPQPGRMERRRAGGQGQGEGGQGEGGAWPERAPRPKRRAPPPALRGRRLPLKPEQQEDEQCPAAADPAPEPAPLLAPSPEPEPAPSPLPTPPDAPHEPPERCMRWEGGRLRYTPAVEQLEFAFESVPRSEPWFETFKRQDEDKLLARNVPQYFALYSKSPKLPYEIGQLPPLKPNCCPLSDLVKREERPGPSRSYGTRGMKKQKIRKRTAAILALEGHSRKSPREHASTLAILGSAGLLNRRKHADDAKSTASEDTISDTHSTAKTEPIVSEAQEASERLQQFLSEVFEDAADYEISEEAMEGEPAVTASSYVPDVSSLVSECEDCDIIRNEIKEGVEARGRGRRGKFKKKNRTGWPNKKKVKKDSRTNSVESQKADSSVDRSSAEPPDDDTTQDAISEEDTNQSETENEKTLIQIKEEETLRKRDSTDVEDSPPRKRRAQEKRISRSSTSESEKEDRRKKKRALAGLLLQPVVRVARVDPAAARRLRSGAAPRPRRR